MWGTLDCFGAVIDPVIHQSGNLCTLRKGLVLAVMPGAGVLKREMGPFNGRRVFPRRSGLVSPSDIARVAGVLDEGSGRVEDREVLMGNDPFRIVANIEEKLASLDVKSGDVAWGASWRGWGGELVSKDITVFVVRARRETLGPVSV